METDPAVNVAGGNDEQGGFVGRDLPQHQSSLLLEPESQSNEHPESFGSLFARHLCPICPANATLSGKARTGVPVSYCCRARKAITRTKIKTVTSMRTIRKTITRSTSKVIALFFIVREKKSPTLTSGFFLQIANSMDTIAGRLFYDYDGSKTFTGPDAPIAFFPIVLIAAPVRRGPAAPGAPLSAAITNVTGHFVFRGNFPSSTQLLIADNATRSVLHSLETGPDGEPVVQPGDVAVAPPVVNTSSSTRTQIIASSTLRQTSSKKTSSFPSTSRSLTGTTSSLTEQTTSVLRVGGGLWRDFLSI